MMRSIAFTKLLLWGALLLAGSATTAQAQWDPWLMGPRYQTSYYTPSFFNGYWGAGYAPAPAYSSYYGPAADCGCCGNACDACGNGCNSCTNGNCASGNCSLNQAPSGSMRPIPNTDDRGNYGKDAPTPIPGRDKSSGTGRNKTFEENDRSFEEPRIDSGRPGTGNPPKKPYGTGTGTGSDDGFRTRPEDTDTKADPFKGSDPFKANKPDLNDPVLPNVPDKVPAAPADVKEETPLDAALDLDTRITNRPVLMRDRFVARSRAVTPSRAAYDWSAIPADPRVVRK